MKILYVLPSYRFFSLDINKVGGHIAHIIGVIDALKKKGHQIIVCSYDRIPFYNSEIEYKILKYRDLKIPKIRRIYRDYIFCDQLLNIIGGIKPDMVYIRWSPNLFWGRICKKKNFKLVFECNTPLTMFLGRDASRISRPSRFISKYIDTQICKNADVISAISKGVKDFLVDNIPSSIGKTIVNPNGVDCDKFKPEGDDCRKEYRISKSDIVIGFAANFRPWQGIEIIINAFQSLDKNEYNNIRLILIGTGDKNYVNQLKGLAAKARTDDIIFTGPVPFNRMPVYLRTCDILVSPQNPTIGSVFHQSPVKLYEYMATGRAIIVSNIGQSKEVIRNGYSGILFECGKDDALASKIKLLIKDKSLRKQISKNARIEAVNKHSWINHVDRFLEALGK